MKIFINKPCNVTRFADLGNGSVFRYQGDYYVKVHIVDKKQSHSSLICNVLFLSDFAQSNVIFNGCTEVELMSATLTLE